jgi:phthalate 4,5-dioxygenase oxygenase subunit
MDGRLGLIAEACPHRGASLFFGRNEQDGLRCVYHGWKYDGSGRCADMPSEPPESNFKNKVVARAYPSIKLGGVIWTYMGEGDPPGVPQFEWTLVPAEQRHFAISQRHCNWLQALEGDIDTSHLYFLHGRLNPDDPTGGAWHADKHPRLEIIPTDYGTVYGANREEDEATTYWRIAQFMFPIFTFFPASPDGVVPGHMWVPLDDHTTRVWTLRWHPATPLDQLAGSLPGVSLNPVGEHLPDESTGLGRWRPRARASNDYEIDHQVQRTKNFTGIPTTHLQDQAVTKSMGSVQNRTIEHLGTSDGMIIQTRQRLLNAVVALRDEGVTLPCVEHPEWYKVRSCSATLPKGAAWHTELHDWLYAVNSHVPEVKLNVAR